ncbi:uncharacterized protein METZ01_LOCUS43147 [marine metagenome]|jgi:hypothetical protein|uniref:Uncharacterized protein n=1 Tax=marine metagenome TaxID=408172 RepID=A0A381RMX2_9ZZZZ|tara:strand:- start:5468 stop:5587 length:120 start_codon:yes stop_codon:yes gene_type:complete
MDITFIAWAFLFSVLGYYLYENLYVESSGSSAHDNDEEE